METFKNLSSWLYNWCELTSRPLGWFYLLFVLVTQVPTITEKTIFSVTCSVAQYRCGNSWDPTRYDPPSLKAPVSNGVAEMLDDPNWETTVTQVPAVRKGR